MNSLITLSRTSRAWKEWMVEESRERCARDQNPVIVHSSFDHASASVAWIKFEPFLCGCGRYSVWFMIAEDQSPRLVLTESIAQADSKRHCIDRVAVDRGDIAVRDRRLLETRDLSWVPMWRYFTPDQAQIVDLGTGPLPLPQYDRPIGPPTRQQFFVDRVERAIQKTAATKHSDLFWRRPPLVVQRLVDTDTCRATWIVFEHLTTDETWPSGLWKTATFRYNVWYLDELLAEPKHVDFQSVVKYQPKNRVVSTQELAADACIKKITQYMS